MSLEGGDLLIYPEGAWNITENQVVMPLYTGTAEMAIRTGAEIIPIAIEQGGKRYYANIGENHIAGRCSADISRWHYVTDRKWLQRRRNCPYTFSSKRDHARRSVCFSGMLKTLPGKCVSASGYIDKDAVALYNCKYL